MTDKTELQEYIEICRELKNHFKGKECQNRDCPYQQVETCGGLEECRYTPDRFIYFPTIDQLLEMLGDRFKLLRRLNDSNYSVDCVSNHFPVITLGQSARIALAKAVKEVKDETN